MAQALISVSDKNGAVNFARELVKKGYNIISSGGTYKELKSNGVAAKEITEVTGFPEILDGRVKTLNPIIHGGILAMRAKQEHLLELKKHSIQPIDIVAVNLYPFEDTLLKLKVKKGAVNNELIENIDIGGVALLRAAAKNYKDVIVICEAADYTEVIKRINDGACDEAFRKKLAAKAFRHTAYYDSLISGAFTDEIFPEKISVPLKRVTPLRYGENPHQEASLYKNSSVTAQEVMVNAKQLQGKELSYNNYLDLEAAWRLAIEFTEPVCAIIKHTNPCGCALGKGILEAYKKALTCDPISAFGGILAFNRSVDKDTAAEVVKLFTECIVAPSYSAEALEIFSTKKNLRLLTLSLPAIDTFEKEIEYRNISGAMLVQYKDNQDNKEFKNAAKIPVDEKMLESLKFAWKISKHVKSNAIVLVKADQTVGVGAGQMSRIDSLKIASEKMKSVKILDTAVQNAPLVLASDAFFPFPDVVNESAKLGVKAIIQPGGSIKDEDSIKACNDQGLAMVFTGMRHFKH